MGKLRAQAGFTLIELSIVLVVIAIISAMGISAGTDAVETARRVSTEKKLDVIEDALFTFRKKYGRLPCPADAELTDSNANFGLEAANMTGTCTGGTPAATYLTTGTPANVPSGAVPARTLQLPDEFMVDGWEMQFQYEVTPAMTRDQAFSFSWPSDTCSLIALDASGATMPVSPVYSLLSHGKNGAGAYTKTGAQVTSVIAGTAEETNIRPSTGVAVIDPAVRIMSGASGKSGSANYYDDIVRFKSRYQMLDTIDRSTELYKGAELVLAYDTDSGIQFVYGKKKCGAMQSLSVTDEGTIGDDAKFVSFTPGNTHLFAYYTGNCKLYMNNGAEIESVTAPSPLSFCPDATTTGAIAQESGALALNSNDSPYAHVYRPVGSGMDMTYAELANALDPALPSQPTTLSFSQNGEYLAVANAVYARLYVKKGDHYSDRGTFGVYSEMSNAISPNGKYYAIADNTGGNTVVRVWRNVNGAFSLLSDTVTVAGLNTAPVLVFSPNSEYLAVGGSSVSSGDNLVVVYINPVSEAVTSTAFELSTEPVAASFSGDNLFLAVARDGSGTNSIAIFRRTDNNFTLDTTSSTFSFNGSVSASSVAMSR